MPRRFVPGPFPRLHLVTPSVVEWTIGRLGVGGILNDRERRVVDGFAGAGIAAVARTATDGSVGVDIECSDGRPTSARIADARAPRHYLGVRHRTVGGYTVAVAVYRAAA